MADARKVVRGVAAAAAFAVLSIAVYPIAGEFLVELAQEKGLHQEPGRRVAAVSGAILALAAAP